MSDRQLRDTEHFKRHLSVVVWRQDNGGRIDKIGDVPIEDPFHRTKVQLGFSLWAWLKFLFTRREIEIVVHVRSDGVSQGRWFQGADICDKCQRARIDSPYEPGYRRGDEVWCSDCHFGTESPPTTQTVEGGQP